MIIADQRIPQQAKEQLLLLSDVVFFESNAITYPAVSGHPDIFFCKANHNLIVAPNLPEKFKEEFKKRNLTFLEGEKPVGKEYPATAIYNAVITENFLIHNLKYTDNTILEASRNLEMINVNQAYTRCNLLALPGDKFITSDRGIEKTLKRKNLKVLFVSPEEIILPGFEHGFFGGSCGFYDGKLFILGNLDHFSPGKVLQNFLDKAKIDVVELYDGPLFDGGSILIF